MFFIYISLSQVGGAKEAHIEHINEKFDGLTKDFTDSEYDYAVNFSNSRIPAMRKAQLNYKNSREFIAYNEIKSLRVSTSN
ncbi:hypothetical protein CSB62_18315 [Vibrio splendidus]|nr:hypothetical protein CSB62_18315 [Vibrio splendidus]